MKSYFWLVTVYIHSPIKLVILKKYISYPVAEIFAKFWYKLE